MGLSTLHSLETGLRQWAIEERGAAKSLRMHQTAKTNGSDLLICTNSCRSLSSDEHIVLRRPQHLRDTKKVRTQRDVAE
ncbi:unnamed protein product [Soboliphyme baturini]|uniref:Uncharacterized protein n=1 Tax=Soboliphyme baturini TaxID=241478 RepID=A0A183J3H2_9BILA|nr:unnamed protein product [Soboliphyme baturini]